jgi:hypothetical protein
MKIPKRVVVILALTNSVMAHPLSANNVGENIAWQFLTPAERANLMYLEEVRQRRINGFYSAPIYNTYINDQYNCSVNSTATGNLSSSNAVANSPSSSGNTADSTGNENDTTDRSGNLASGGSNATEQENEGEISSRASGEMSTSVRGDNFQALNTDQVNSGNQASTINGSTACQYASAG